MNILGKILGVFFGFLFAYLPGALIGLFIGHLFDTAKSSPWRVGALSPSAKKFKQSDFCNAAYAVMGHVAKAKGQVTQEEIRLATLVMDQMQLNNEQRQAAQNAFREGKASHYPLDETIKKVYQSADQTLLNFFLELQVHAAFASGQLHPNERKILQRIAEGLGFSDQQLEQRLLMQNATMRFRERQKSYQEQASRQQYSQKQSSQERSTHETDDVLADAFNILGVKSSDDDKKIKQAYRKLMNENHPDKLAAKGLPPEMMEVAKQKTQEIQAAYDLIKKNRK